MIALRTLVTSFGVAVGVFYPFLSVILASRGFAAGEIGLIFAIGAVGFTVAVPVWGHLADVHLGRPRTLQVCAIGAGLVVAALLGVVEPIVVVVLLLLFWIFQSAWQPLTDAITVNITGGRGYARTRLFGSAGFVVATVGAGFLYSTTGYTPAYLLFALGAAVMALVAWRLPDVGRADLDAHRRGAAPRVTDRGADEPPVTDRPSTRRLPSLGSTGVAFRVSPQLGAVLAGATLLYFGIISGFTFLPLRIEDLGGTPTDVALSAGLSAAMEVPAMLVIGFVGRRVGIRVIFVAAAAIYAACMVSWMIIDDPLVIVATRAATGIAFAGVVVGVVLTIAAILPRDLQGTGQSLVQTSASGLGAIVANIVGGVLYQEVGHAAVFGLGAILAVVAGLIGWRAFPREHAR